MTSTPQPLEATTDIAHGGRWTSLRTAAGREWLWRNDQVSPASRHAAQPGDAFVDAGGIEECFPSLNGAIDHGDVWTRPWQALGADGAAAATTAGGRGELRIERRIAVSEGVLTATYTITGPPGAGVIHAVHGLYDCSEHARVLVPEGTRADIQDHPRPGAITTTSWPDGDGVDLSTTAGPDGVLDGTGRCSLVQAQQVGLEDGSDRLLLDWRLLRGSGTVSLVTWRNMGVLAVDRPYRSIGLEPLLGGAVDITAAGEEDLAHLDAEGVLIWQVSWRAGLI